jgi:uncharacterized membrane protein (DUF4010 family)
LSHEHCFAERENGAFLLVSYRHKLFAQQAVAEAPGVITEISGLGTYLLGALVYQGHYWIAATIAVVSLLLLELKDVLEGLTKRIAPQEILTRTKFLLLTAVILPILPNTDFTQFRINPFKTWLVVVAVSGISYGSYVLLSLTRQKSGVILSAVLGGAYSSTATTVALAKRASAGQQPHLFSGAILLASGMMYVRLTVLLMLFSHKLLVRLAAALMILACVAGLAGWLWSRVPRGRSERARREFQPRNPLELRAAVLFAALFLAVLVVIRVAVTHLGNTGIYGLAAIVGFMDVDPFVLGMTQSAGALTPESLAAIGILVAASSNNVAKGIYAYAFADWSFNVGLRGDFYNGLTTHKEAQPRLGVAYNIKRTNTVLRVSYARLLETPFNENLIVASVGCDSPVLNPLLGCASSASTPLSPGWRNEFHAGLQQAFGKYLVFSGEYVWKYTHTTLTTSASSGIHPSSSRLPGTGPRSLALPVASACRTSTGFRRSWSSRRFRRASSCRRLVGPERRLQQPEASSASTTMSDLTRQRICNINLGRTGHGSVSTGAMTAAW